MIWNMSRPDGVLKSGLSRKLTKATIGAQLREGINQMFWRTTETIDLPPQHSIELPPVSVGHVLVQLGSRFL
jgi:hypothetical protein